METLCYCMRVSKDEVVRAIEEGCDTVDKLAEMLQVTRGCGCCYPDIVDLLRFVLEDRSAASGKKSGPAA